MLVLLNLRRVGEKGDEEAEVDEEERCSALYLAMTSRTSSSSATVSTIDPIQFHNHQPTKSEHNGQRENKRKS